MNIRDFKTVKERREVLEKEVSVDLKHIGSGSIDESVASSRNCENMIGVAQIPMGIAGPLVIASNDIAFLKNDLYIPLATTEGALVASVSRGCKAITQSGGAIVGSHKVGATRGPVFRVENLKESKKLYEFIKLHKDTFNGIASSTSKHLTLLKVTSKGVGKYRFVRFVFDTQDAMGMNMVTIATTNISKYIEDQTGARCLAVAANYDTDKKPAWINVLQHRGIKVWAEVTIPEAILSSVLKTTAQNVYDVWLAKCMIGSAVAGSMGFNAHIANIAAAIFLATGQDPAHVVEASVGMTIAEVVGGTDLYMSVYLPDLMVGTVGGGTGLATQQEALSLLGVAGGDSGDNAKRFAEIIGAVALAGEVSLLSSLAQGSLADAHKTLGRGLKISK